jgi:hypothetical protein
VVVEWDARKMGPAARGRGERERGGENIYFLSTNLKFEAFLEGEEEFRKPGQALQRALLCASCACNGMLEACCLQSRASRKKKRKKDK